MYIRILYMIQYIAVFWAMITDIHTYMVHNTMQDIEKQIFNFLVDQIDKYQRWL